MKPAINPENVYAHEEPMVNYVSFTTEVFGILFLVNLMKEKLDCVINVTLPVMKFLLFKK